MTKKLFKKISDTKDPNAREELRRAHAVICLLAISLVFVLVLNGSQSLEFNVWLVTAASILLGVIATISLGIVWLLSIKS